jgi:hypothetical protein
MIARGPRLSSLAMLARAALVAICLLPGPTPARASDFSDCMNGLGGVILAGPESVVELLENPATLPCLALVEDPEFDALVTALAALKAAHKFNTADECKNMLPDLLVQVATDAGVIDSTATAEWDCACRVAVVGLDALKNAINATANLINSCSALAKDVYCDTVGGTDDDCSGVNPPTPPMPKQDDACRAPRPYACGCDQNLKEKPGIDLQQCLKQHPDIFDYAKYCLGAPKQTGFDHWDPNSKLCVSFETGQTYQPVSCAPAVDPNQYSCGFGSQCGVNAAWLAWYNGNPWKPVGPLGPQNGASWSKCVSCDTVTNGAPITDGVCGCKNGYVPAYGTGLSGKKTLLTCSCPAPMKEGKFMGQQTECRCPVFGQVPRKVGGKLICACPANQQLDNGLCRSCNNTEFYNTATLSCEHCPIGQKPDLQDRNKCVNLCKPGEILQGSSCMKCPANTYSHYLIGSEGSCEPCPPGSYSPAGSSACLAPPVPPVKGGARQRFQPAPFQPPPAPPMRMGPGRQRPPMMAPPQQARPAAPPRLRPMQRFRPPIRPIEQMR